VNKAVKAKRVEPEQKVLLVLVEQKDHKVQKDLKV
jgi:hypothetical protein